MVKLQRTKTGGYTISLPKVKCERKGWKGGEAFDIEFNEEGNLVLVKINQSPS